MPAYCRRPRSTATPFRATNARQRPCSAAAPRPAFQLAPHRRLCIDGALALPRRPSRQSSVPAVPLPAAAPHRRCYSKQHLPDGALLRLCLSSGALPRLCLSPGDPPRRPGQHKPHLAEKSTPVWLAIWCTWAGFANSQLWRATFSSTYLYMCPSTFLPNMTAARTEQIFRPICTDCLRHLRISAK